MASEAEEAVVAKAEAEVVVAEVAEVSEAAEVEVDHLCACTSRRGRS